MRSSFSVAALLTMSLFGAALAQEAPRDSTFPAPWGGLAFSGAQPMSDMFSDLSISGPSDLGVTEDLSTNRLEGIFTITENGLGDGRIFDPSDFGLEGIGADQFEIDASDCSGPLAGGATCQVRVRLRADAAEGHHSAVLVDRVSGRQIAFSGAYIPPPPRGEAVFATPGTFNFVVPARVTSINVQVWGGGGGSPINHCFGQRCFCCAGGGGGGGYSAASLAVRAGDVYQIVVGAGGIAAEPGWPSPDAVYIGHAMKANNPKDGGTSSVSGPGGTLWATGGQTPNATNAGGAGGIGGGGEINLAGTAGGQAFAGDKGIYHIGRGGVPMISNAWGAGVGARVAGYGGNNPGAPGLVIIRWGQ